MGTLYEKLNGDTATKNRVKPFTPVSSSTPAIAPPSLQLLRQNATSTPQTASERMAVINRDRERGLSISQGTADPVQVQRQGLSGIPVIGQFLTGRGPQGPSNSLYNPGSMQQDLVEKGIVGFFLEGFQKKLSPTREEVGEQIFTRYEKLQEIEKNPNRALNLAISDVIKQSPGKAQNINDLKDPGIKLSKEEKEALFWTNTLEDAFAVLDAPVFIGSTKIPKNALLSFLKKANKAEDIIPRLRMIGISEEVANKVSPKIAKSFNELEIAKLIEDAKTATKDSAKPSLFSRIQDKVVTKLTPGRTSRFAEDARQTSKIAPESTPARNLIKRVDEVEEGASERFFRSTQGGKVFDEIKPDEVTPAFIREDLDTFVTKLGDEFQVIEGKTGQQIGDGGRSVAEAVQKAKTEVEELGSERLNEFLTNSPLSPRYTQVADKAPTKAIKELPKKLPAGVITADKLRLTDKAAARRLAKLENMAKTAPDVDSFVDNSGITRESLDKTVQKQGYKDSEQFFNTNRPERVSKGEVASRSRQATPDTRTAPDDEQYYSLLAEQEAGDTFKLAFKKEEAEAVVDNLRAVFADMKGIEVEDALKFTEEDLYKAQVEYEFVMDSLMDDPARALSKYANKNGELPEVLGGEFRTVLKKGKQVRVRNSEFARRGDDIATELGFEYAEEARDAYAKYLKRKADAAKVLDNLRKVRNSIRLAKQMNTFVEVNQKKLAAEFMKNRKALTAIVEAAERAGFRKGMAKGNEKMEKLVNRLRSRRHTISGIKFRYNLSPSEVRKTQEAAQKEMKDLAIPDDPRFMTKDEFSEYVKQMEIAAKDIEDRRVERGIVKAVIEQKGLKNTENIREVMGLPNLSEMTLDQLKRYDEVLSKFQDNDEFLSKRTLEVIDRTALKGARTMRQVQEFFAKEIKRVTGRDVKPSELQDLVASPLDYIRWDSSLAEKDPFMDFFVNRAQTHMLAGKSNALRIRDIVEELAKKANKSRNKVRKTKEYKLKTKRELAEAREALKMAQDPNTEKVLKATIRRLKWSLGIRGKIKRLFAPSHHEVIRFLEARGTEKDMYWKALTKEEQEYARFMRNYYNNAYNYLSYINELEGSRFIDAYFTHTRKTFFEKWIDDGFVSAVKGFADSAKEDFAVSQIINPDTGQILPKSKFFQYTLFRSGEGEASQNATKTFLHYMEMFERKKMLDRMVPELDIYTNTLTPPGLTQTGLQMDRSLKKFVNTYLNNKRGRKMDVTPLIPQNGGVDIFLRLGNTVVSLLDLGWSLTAGSAAAVGEQIANYIILGKVGTLKAAKRRIWDTGMKRMATKEGQSILKQAEPFIGRNIWTDIAEVDTSIIEKGLKTGYGLFGQSTVEANKMLVLGAATKAEMKAGKLSAERMAQLRIDAGRWRDMGDEVKSILGATSAGKTVNKYKGWAIPIFRTSAKNLKEIADMMRKGEIKDLAKSRQLHETIREIEVTAAALYVGSIVNSAIPDDSFLGKLKARVMRETLTILQGLDPRLFLSMPRLGTWMYQLADNIITLALMEEYKTDSKYGDKGDNKGWGALKRQFTPAFLRQFIPDPKPKSKRTTKTGTKLDDLNRLDKLDGLNKLDKLDRLDRLDELDSLDSL